jgi:hypothetical protein
MEQSEFNMKLKKLAGLTLGIASLAFVSTSSNATIWFESVDAGETLATSLSVGNGTTRISGSLLGGSADMFLFSWGGGSLDIDTLGSSFDTQLTLFDSAGYGLVQSDDPGFGSYGTLSFISELLVAGDYLIAVSGYNFDPDSILGPIFDPDLWTGRLDPDGSGGLGPLTGWVEHAGRSVGGDYEINFSTQVSAAVPAPSIIALFGLGLVGIGFARRRQA